MYCDDCGSETGLDIHDYVKRKDERGTVLCDACDNSFIKRIMNGEMRAHEIRA